MRMKTKAEVIEQLIATRALVEAGWIQHRPVTWDGDRVSVCLLGGLYIASGMPVDMAKGELAPSVPGDAVAGVAACVVALVDTIFGEKVTPVLDEVAGRLTSWNDFDGRQKAEVVDLIDRTLARLMAAPAAETPLASSRSEKELALV
jgi:hypothetical protein